MARLYSNENFPISTVRHLCELGHDVLTTRDTGLSGLGIPDEQVLEYATRLDRCVITINRKDFMRLHRAGLSHAGIIVCTENLDYQNMATRIHEALAGREKLHGQLLRVYRGDQRI